MKKYLVTDGPFRVLIDLFLADAETMTVKFHLPQKLREGRMEGGAEGRGKEEENGTPV